MSLLGLDIVGADYGAILSTVFQAAGGAVDYAKQAQADKDMALSADSALAQAIAADQAATSAVAKAALSAMLKSSAAGADKAAADNALAVQDSAGAALAEEKRADRVKAAQEAVDAASKRVSVSKGSMKTVVQATLDAAKQTLAKAKGIVTKSEKKTEEPGLFAKVLYSGYTWAAAVALGVVIVLKRK